MEKKKAYLLLANGQIFEGFNFGISGTSIGEVVFATGMTGYQETLTDPSYYGQIAVQTFPLVGNYGINDQDFESEKSWMKGYIVREFCEMPSNFRLTGTLDAFLKAQKIVGLYGIDTRALTRVIREHGVMNGMITTEDVYANREAFLAQVQAYVLKDGVKQTSTKEVQTFQSERNQYHVVLMDFGYKHSILDKLLKRDCRVSVVPHSSTAEEILAMRPDGIMLSNGPGNPEENQEIIANLQLLIKAQVPIFGICLGHQLLALANGARTEKLKYGHRGANQPVKDVIKDRVFVTSQNHNYAVVGESLSEEIGYISHYNVNDRTCEGIMYLNAPAFTVQFHPEACSGPEDTVCLFNKFIELMNKEGK